MSSGRSRTRCRASSGRSSCPTSTRIPRSGALRAATAWEEFVAEGDDEALPFAQVAFDHPLWVLYSSGTTGLPKAIVHGHGGILLELLKKLHLHVDLQEDDRLFWFTTTGWMMWNFVMGGLLTRASVVLYDGNPGHPDLGTLWDLAESAGITCFGTSASYVAACVKAGVEPAAGRDLSRLARSARPGRRSSPEGFDWVYEHLGPDLWLFSTSGGTDVCTAFVGGVPTLPVYRGELQARALGAKVEAWSPEGTPLVGEVGELVITEPMPSMPLRFWGDEDGERYRASYFDVFPGVWRHGDWIELTERGTAIITGRSDATINRGGIRMGTAEIYRAVLSLDEVVDALVVDLPREGTQGWMPLFVVLRDGATLDDALVGRLRDVIRRDCSPRHVPDEVLAVPAVPRTLSGKVLEVPVKRILSGEPADTALSRDSLADPAALRPFEELAATSPSRQEDGMTYVADDDRYGRMPYRRTGRSGLKLPAISLGLWNNFGADRPLETSRAIVRRAFDLGVTHFDLANNYGPPYGSAEETFGRLLATDLAPYRDELLVSTKAGYDMWPGPVRRVGLAEVPPREPRPEPPPPGPRLRRHLLLAPVRPRDAARGDDGRARHGRPPGQGALRRDLVVPARAARARRPRSSTGSARRS